MVLDLSDPLARHVERPPDLLERVRTLAGQPDLHCRITSRSRQEAPPAAKVLAAERLRRENLRRALAALPEREREVIEMRFGLTGERPYTLEEVGRAFNVTRERIRQIENHTLKKLEALPEAQRLRDAS